MWDEHVFRMLKWCTYESIEVLPLDPASEENVLLSNGGKFDDMAQGSQVKELSHEVGCQ